MPPDLPIRPSEWSSLTPIGVCLGLLTIIVLVGIPWLLVQHRRELKEVRREQKEERDAFLKALEKEAAFRNEMLDRAEKDREHQWERYEASLREIMQRNTSRRSGG